MKKTLLLGALGLLVFCMPALAADQATPYEIKQARNTPIIMNKAKHPRMHVLFDHKAHNGISCFSCHHKKVDGFALLSCSSDGCHTDLDRKSRAAGSYFQAMHRKDNVHSCVGCHAQKTAQRQNLDSCSTCHDANRGKIVAKAR